MQELLVSPMLTFQNLFPKEAYTMLEKIALLTKGMIAFNRPNRADLEKFCQYYNFKLSFSADSLKAYTNFCNVYILLYTDKYVIQFRSKYPPDILQNPNWNRLTTKANSSLRFESSVPYLYQLTLACELLRENGYAIEYAPNLKWLDHSISPSPITTFDCAFTPLPHQKENCTRFFEEKTCGCIIADDAGTGKTSSVALILKRLYDEGKVKTCLWVEPYYALAEQNVLELKRHFNLDSHIICGESYSPEERYDPNTSPYKQHGCIFTTWGTLYKDWCDNFDKLRSYSFDAVIFDEVHIAKKGTTTYTAMQNVRAKYRFGLTGTPTKNGDWNELFDVIYVINPLLLPPYEEYNQEYRRLIKNYTESPSIVNGYTEDAEKTATKVMNIAYIPEMQKMIYRHSRQILGDLPEIKELIISVKETDEEKHISLLYWNLYTALSHDKRMNFSDMTIQASQLVIYNQMYRFCAFGKQVVEHKLQEILISKNKSSQYLQDNYAAFIGEIESALNSASKSEVRPFAKFQSVCDHLKTNMSHRIVIFCGDSVITAIELALYLQQNSKDSAVKVITGKNKELKNYKKQLQALNQSSKMEEKEIGSILQWFWSPFSHFALLPELLRPFDPIKIQYMLDGVEKQFVTQVELINATSITFYAKCSQSISTAASFEDIFTDIREMDAEAQCHLEKASLSISFKPFHSQNKRVLISTEKLEVGCNLQIASAVIFYSYPYNILEYDQRSSRIRRVGSPFESVLLVSFVYGMEKHIQLKTAEKYSYVSEMGFNQADKLKASEKFDSFKSYITSIQKQSKLKFKK